MLLPIQRLSRRLGPVALTALLSIAALAQPSFADSNEVPGEEIVPMANQVPPPPSGPRPAPAQIPAPAQVPRPAPPASAQPPAGTITQRLWLWQRTAYSDGTTIVASDPSKYTLAFLADGRFSILADCNRGTGSYSLARPQLTLRPGPLTLAACGPASQDGVFLRDLQRVASHVFDGELLVLNLQVDGGHMVFAPQPPVSLAGVAWRVQSVNNGRGGVVSVLAETQLSATFGDDGAVNGDTGCNLYRGPYTVSGSTIAFGPLTSTRRACLSNAAAAQEQAFLAALATSTRFELVGDGLTLRDAAGATQVVLVRPTIQPPSGGMDPAASEAIDQ